MTHNQEVVEIGFAPINSDSKAHALNYYIKKKLIYELSSHYLTRCTDLGLEIYLIFEMRL